MIGPHVKNGKNAKRKSAVARPRLHMIGNAHIDPVWLWRWPEGYHEVKATFRSALDRLAEDPDFIFISSSAAFYAWIEESDPHMFAEIQQRVAEGRWELVGGWWIQPDCNIPGGESFVRQGLYGQRYFQEKFGRMARVGYNVDSFGHNAALPQILSKSGLDSYVFLRPSPHEKGLPGRLFWWEADDCSRVLAFRIPYEYCTWGQELEQHVQRCAGELRAPFNDLMCFYGVGNHGGGPTKQNLESIHHLQQDPRLPELVFSTPERFFETVRAQNLPIPTVHDELQHHASGCYAAHSAVKRWNRQAENSLLRAEKFAAIATRLTNCPYPPELEHAWKDVLFNQFHDILAGTSLEAAYEDARDLYGEAQSIAGRALNRAVQFIGWAINLPDEPGQRPYVIFNPHAWQSQVNIELELADLAEDEVLLDAQGCEVPYQVVQSAAAAKGRYRVAFIAGLPPLGYTVYRFVRRPSSPPAPSVHAVPAVHASDAALENDHLRLELDPNTGCILSLWDKRHNLELFAGPAARPLVYADPSDTWGHNTFRFDQPLGQFQPVSVRLVEQGSVRAVLRATYTYGSSRLEQDFILYRDLEQIEVRVMVDWHEASQVLKLRFPLNLIHMRPMFEIPYGVIERFANGEEEPGQSWLDVSGLSRDNGAHYGLSLINDGKYSFDINIRDIGLTVLRSPEYANHLPIIPEAGGHYTYIDQGVQNFTYWLLPHAGSWEGAGTLRRAAELNQPAVVLPATCHAGPLPLQDSFLALDQANIQVTVLKQAEGSSDLVLRCVEMARTATRATLRLPHWNRTLELDFGPAEIKTLRIPQDERQPAYETDLLERPLAPEASPQPALQVVTEIEP